MKTRRFSGWKTRVQSVLLAALCGVAALTALPAFAQDPATPAPVETAAAPAAEAPLVAPEVAPADTTSAPAEVVATEAVAPVEAAAAEEAAPAEEAPAPSISKPDTVWVLVCAALVIFMTLPGLALFYGGLVRSKNVLSILIQNLAVFSLVAVLWALYGYSFAFTEGNAFIGGTNRVLAAGLNASSIGATFTKGVYIPELAFFVFQGAFACITCALVVGAFAERVKFAGVMLFTVLWFTFAYLPMAHMVWFFPGPDAFTSTEAVDGVLAKSGYLWAKGALDFAGGTVVHINAAIAGLVGAYVIGKRTGYGREAIKPHNLTQTMVGASILWVGWFGFNAGSALEAGGVAAIAFVNTFLATAAAVVAWLTVEWIGKGKPSLLGAASGAVAGLVAITPAAGLVGLNGALVIGAIAGVVCLWGVSGLKRLLGADDSLDVFGVHGVGGITGALLTGVFAAPSLGGAGIWDYVTETGVAEYSIGSQVWIQAQGVLITIALSGVVALVSYLIVKYTVGLRVSEEAEREGLDITSHGEAAYES
ncbi:ammonium transporter [Thermomonas carbonis]|uniref:Ammonium transporter n=1 Tax=Thermomonas carbonis TaxID=1463158 RepID=A0A7G9STA3_9GAMM|nr:ammonium transporter [Thermomonas carbonis]QNN71078.1 ammonium transporter [Thermomonas carbonis]GHC04437.1 ammonium transporter [Thermomonas carbonis]